MKMRDNIIKLINSGITAYTVANESGLPRNTVYRIFTGEAKLDNVSLKNAEALNEYFLNNKEEIEMKITIKQFEEIALPGSWELAGMEIITGMNDTKEIVEEMANLYMEENDVETASQFVLRKLEEEDRVKEADAYEEETDDIMWVDEIDRWIELDV